MNQKNSTNFLQNKSLPSKGCFFLLFVLFCRLSRDGVSASKMELQWMATPGRVMNLRGLVCIFQVGKNLGRNGGCQWLPQVVFGQICWQDCIDPVPIPLGYKKEEINNTEDGVKGAEGPCGWGCFKISCMTCVQHTWRTSSFGRMLYNHVKYLTYIFFLRFEEAPPHRSSNPTVAARHYGPRL